MKLYFSKGTCSLAVRITLNELNIPCEFVSVDLKKKVLEDGQDYITINPKGSVPALELKNGEILTENVAIQQYLADNFKGRHLLPKVGDIKRYRIIEWLNFIATDLHKNFGPFFNPKIPKDTKEKIFAPILKSKLAFVNSRLGQDLYLCFNSFSLADSYFFTVLTWLQPLNFNIDEWSSIKNYYLQMKTRPAIQRSLTEELNKSS